MDEHEVNWRSRLELLLTVLLVAILFLSMARLASAESPLTPPIAELAFGPINSPDPAHSSIAADPATIRADGFSQSLITAQIRDNLGLPVPDQFVGFCETSGCGTIRTAFVQAEGAEVARFGSWTTVAQAAAYGGQFIRTDGSISPTDYVTWSFWGEGVSVIVGVGPDGGTATYEVDGTLLGTWDLYAPVAGWKVEHIVSFKFPAATHVVRVNATNTQERPLQRLLYPSGCAPLRRLYAASGRSGGRRCHHPAGRGYSRLHRPHQRHCRGGWRRSLV